MSMSPAKNRRATPRYLDALIGASLGAAVIAIPVGVYFSRNSPRLFQSLPVGYDCVEIIANDRAGQRVFNKLYSLRLKMRDPQGRESWRTFRGIPDSDNNETGYVTRQACEADGKAIVGATQ